MAGMQADTAQMIIGSPKDWRCSEDSLWLAERAHECALTGPVCRQGLEAAIGVSVVHPTWQKTKPDDPNDEHCGWTFASPDDPPFQSPNGRALHLSLAKMPEG